MEHAVIAYLPLTESSFGSERERMIVADLAGKLEKTIREHDIGEFDGEEFGGGQCVIYMYGRDADLLFAAVEPILRATPLATGGVVIKRYGEAEDLGAAEVRVDL